MEVEGLQSCTTEFVSKGEEHDFLNNSVVSATLRKHSRLTSNRENPTVYAFFRPLRQPISPFPPPTLFIAPFSLPAPPLFYPSLRLAAFTLFSHSPASRTLKQRSERFPPICFLRFVASCTFKLNETPFRYLTKARRMENV